MKIIINHIAKTEGHGGMIAEILDGNINQTRLQIDEGARLVEGILLGRYFYEAPIVTARICGICPVVHTLTSCKAMEAALGIKITEPVTLLREILEQAQLINSHGMHLFFLSFPDLVNLSNDLQVIKKYPQEAAQAIKIREFGTNIVKILGGRIVHPLTPEIGGFKNYPNQNEIDKLLASCDEALKNAIAFAKIFINYHYPKFARKTEYISLREKNKYAIYNGNIFSSYTGEYSPMKFYREEVTEFQKQGREAAKFVRHGDNGYLTGALARVNNNHQNLNSEAKKLITSFWPFKQDHHASFPSVNSFHNLAAQAIEIVHATEEVKKLLNTYRRQYLKNTSVYNTAYKIRAGKGGAVIEAPRGPLFDYYELDDRGKIKNCNIITPTAQNIDNLEEDLKLYLEQIKTEPVEKIREKLEFLLRAYDPCFSCAVH